MWLSPRSWIDSVRFDSVGAGPTHALPTGGVPLPASQIRQSKQPTTQLENEIRETMDSLELRTAEAEARRLRADRGTAKLQREQVCVDCVSD